jgi:hypothetical protein
LPPSLLKSRFLSEALTLIALTALGIAVSGYHLGIEDQAIYLPAIERQLHPNLFPHDAELFLAQTRPTLFPQILSAAVRWSHLPLDWVLLQVQVICIFLVLWACLRITRRIFDSSAARWAGVALISVMLSLPVAGTALAIADEYLHPRALATALLLFMLVEVINRKLARAITLFFLAAIIHLQMAFYGLLLAIFFLLPLHWFIRRPQENSARQVAASLSVFPISSIFEPPTAAWREAVRSRWQLYLLRWPWYCWVGIFAPLALLAWFRRLGSRKQMPRLREISARLVAYGIFVFLAAAVLTIPPRFERLLPYQPMRGFHLLYIFLLLLGGGLIGEFFLKAKPLRWALFFLPLCLIMAYVQHQVFPASPHIEWPSAQQHNPWLEAFDWAKRNTPEDAYFALDPNYLARPGEDEHGFRALAQRSMMADYVKDSGVALLFPAVAARWQKEVHARDGWPQFRKLEFMRLRADFGVDWVLLERSQPARAELECPYVNEAVAVCKLE